MMKSTAKSTPETKVVNNELCHNAQTVKIRFVQLKYILKNMKFRFVSFTNNNFILYACSREIISTIVATNGFTFYLL